MFQHQRSLAGRRTTSGEHRRRRDVLQLQDRVAGYLRRRSGVGEPTGDEAWASGIASLDDLRGLAIAVEHEAAAALWAGADTNYPRAPTTAGVGSFEKRPGVIPPSECLGLRPASTSVGGRPKHPTLR